MHLLLSTGEPGDSRLCTPFALSAASLMACGSSQGTEISRMLLSCVADPALADADSLDLRWRLLAVLQYTALRGSVAINLYDRSALITEVYPKDRSCHARQDSNFCMQGKIKNCLLG